MLENLKNSVLNANIALQRYNLVTFTWGNASGIDRELGLVVIKPSGVSYDNLKLEDLIVVDLDGNIVEGKLRPSSDTATHLVLYKNYKELGGIVHTHSTWATTWAQARKNVPCFGTTHADTFYGEILCTRALTQKEITGEYETETGNVIVETFRNKDITTIPGVLVHSHGPFSWGKDATAAVHNAVILEEVCKMAFNTVLLNPDINKIDDSLLDKHFLRKHGKNSYYGQNK